MCSYYQRLILFTALFTTVITSSQRCPSICSCKWKNGKETVECPDKNLSDVPDGIDKGTQVLDLNRNAISSLTSKLFVNRDLLHLQKLYLEDNSISEIATEAFFKLTNLIDLDLAGNQIAHVPKHVFKDIIHLRRLQLSRNLIRKIENQSFKLMKDLESLELSYCHIEIIEQAAFSGLVKLKFLKLNNNRITTLPVGTIEVLPPLSALDIHGNPWNCDCQIRGLKVWMGINNIPLGISPSCKEPTRLRNIEWKYIDNDDFACPPTFYTMHTSFKSDYGRNVSLVCTTHAFPNAGIVWQFDMPVSHISTQSSMIGNTMRKNLTSSRAVWRGKYFVHENIFNNKKSSTLVIFGGNQEDSGLYTCIAENRAGSAIINFTLMVSPPLPEPESWSKAQIAGVVLGIFFVVVVMFVAICILVLRQRALSSANSTKYPGVDLLKHLATKSEMHEVNAIVKLDKDMITTSVDKIPPRQETGGSSGYGSDHTPDLTNQSSDAPYISPSKTVSFLPCTEQQETANDVYLSPGEQPIPLTRMHTLGPEDRIGDGGRWYATADLPAYHRYDNCEMTSPTSPNHISEVGDAEVGLPKHPWTAQPGSASDIASDSASFRDESYHSYNSPAHSSTMNWKRTPLVIPNGGLLGGHPHIQRYSPDEGYAEETYEGTEV